MPKYHNVYGVFVEVGNHGEGTSYAIRDLNQKRFVGRARSYEAARAFANDLNRAATDFVNAPDFHSIAE